MSQGYQASLGIDTVNPVTMGFEFNSCSLTRQSQIIDASGMRGSRSHRSERTRLGNYTVSGSIDMEPSAEELALLLPWIMGANASGTTFALADTLTSRYVCVDKVAKVATYAGVYVNRATFSGAEGQAMKLSLDLIGQTETIANAGTFPAVTYQNTMPFMMAEGVLTLVSAARNVRNWQVTIDNMLEPTFYNSQTATSITPRDRVVSFRCTNPYTSSETALYAQALAGSAGTLVLAPSNYSLTFTFATLQFPAMGPGVGGKQELALELNGVARMLSTTKELVVTLDSSP